MTITLAVEPCRGRPPFCGPAKKYRPGSWTACWGCLGDGTHACKGRPDADHDDTKPPEAVDVEALSVASRWVAEMFAMRDEIIYVGDGSQHWVFSLLFGPMSAEVIDALDTLGAPIEVAP